jgi:predicted regulator of amino acid metabolism with ACT domain
MAVRRQIVTKKEEVPQDDKEKLGKNDFFEMIHGAEQIVASPEKKDKVKTLYPESKEVKAAVDKIKDIKKQITELDAEFGANEQVVLDYVQPIQDEDGLKEIYQKSYRIQGNKELALYVSTDKFSAIGPDNVEHLKELLGDKFLEYFIKKTEIKMKGIVFEDGELQIQLARALGKPLFDKCFETKSTFYPVQGFDAKQYKISRDLGKRIFDQVKAFIKKTKASVR